MENQAEMETKTPEKMDSQTGCGPKIDKPDENRVLHSSQSAKPHHKLSVEPPPIDAPNPEYYTHSFGTERAVASLAGPFTSRVFPGLEPIVQPRWGAAAAVGHDQRHFAGRLLRARAVIGRIAGQESAILRDRKVFFFAGPLGEEKVERA